jgi:DNA-binding FadR family transcriptional regulator
MRSHIIAIPGHRALSNHAEVARTIGVDIIAGRYAPDAKLPGDAVLTRLFNVSRPVLREAVKTLVAKGLLSTKARVGTVVRGRAAWNMFDPAVLAWHLDAGVDTRFLSDLAEIRLAVEPRAAALAAERRAEADLVILRDAVARMRDAPGASDAFAEGDLSLHLAVANASGNPFMRSIGAVVEAALRTSFILSAPADTLEHDIAVAAHGRIVEAIADRDVVAAAATMTAVILNGLRRHGAAS